MTYLNGQLHTGRSTQGHAVTIDTAFIAAQMLIAMPLAIASAKASQVSGVANELSWQSSVLFAPSCAPISSFSISGVVRQEDRLDFDLGTQQDSQNLYNQQPKQGTEERTYPKEPITQRSIAAGGRQP